MAKLQEECGVFGIRAVEKRNVAGPVYYALYALQHRGQESAGIAINDNGIITGHADSGLVPEVFTPDVMDSLKQGVMAIGHTRYGSNAESDCPKAQP